MKKLYAYPPLTAGTLIKRYKRFLADVRLEGGRKVTAFCPNSGSMMGLADPGTPVLLSPSENPKRKTRWTLEAVKPGRVWVGVNTHLTNTFAASAIGKGLLKDTPLGGFKVERAEVPYGDSRLDFLLSREMTRDKARDKTRDKNKCYLEVKSVTLKIDGKAMFPDAVTTRGAKHMRELAGIADKGGRAAVLFLVQRADCSCFTPAAHIDPAYADSLTSAADSGVHVIVALTRVRRTGVYFERLLPLCI